MHVTEHYRHAQTDQKMVYKHRYKTYNDVYSDIKWNICPKDCLLLC